MSCLISSRFNMRATVLRQAGTNPQENPGGHWETVQDPDSGAIERVWVPDEDSDTPGDQTLVIKCMVRGVTNGGIRAAGTTQRFSEIYENVDWAIIQFPASVVLSKYDRVTNISNSKGQLVWREEEINQAPATVFQVMGSTPVIDPFGNHIENTALLQRAQVQSG
ncbi:head-to-tail stopper [Streptomyces phage JimJam]|nr:head-to-tail stopper [Streptomyces phage JimJam]